MRLYLVRHGEANSPMVDPGCGLSESGQAEIARLASFIEPMELQPSAVWHSSKLRAAQTAQILSRSLAGSPSLEEHAGLQPNDSPSAIAAEVEAVRDNLMLVGHLPFMALTSSYLLAPKGPPEFLVFRTGTMACLRREGGTAWHLEWMIHPGLLPFPPA